MEKHSGVDGTKGGNLLPLIGGSAIAGFGAALAILLIVSVLSIRLHLSTQEEFSLVEHTVEVLLESEEVLGAIVAGECSGDLGLGGLTTVVTVLGEPMGVGLSGNDVS